MNIIEYRTAWNIKENYGKVQYKFQNGRWSRVKMIKNPIEFQINLDLLRNEKPIYYDEKVGVVRTTSEPIGEGE